MDSQNSVAIQGLDVLLTCSRGEGEGAHEAAVVELRALTGLVLFLVLAFDSEHAVGDGDLDVLLGIDSREFRADDEVPVLGVPMRCFAKVEITRYLWGRDYSHDAHTIESHVSRLRRKFSEIDAERTWITTVRMSGYRLENPRDVEVVTFPRYARALFDVEDDFSDDALLGFPSPHDDVRRGVAHRHLDHTVMHEAR